MGWDNPAACSTFIDEVIARSAGVDVETVRTVLDLFTTSLVQRPPAEVALEFFQGRSPLRVRPILQDPDGSFVVVHSGLLIPAIRERVEEALRSDQRAWDVYSEHRGRPAGRQRPRLVTGGPSGSPAGREPALAAQAAMADEKPWI